MIEPIWNENYSTNTYTASHECRCGARTSATVRGSDLFRYRQGAFVQDAFPYLTDDQREALFISGICSACWDAMFGEEV